MIAILAAIVLGLMVFVLLFVFGYLDNVEQPVQQQPGVVEQRPVVGQIKQLSDEELREQDARRGVVRERCGPAAAAVAAQAKAAASEERTRSLQDNLAVLQKIVNENESDGAIGVVASTELCNALLAADALQALEGLQSDADPVVAKRSSTVFEHVIPRIWSF